MHWHRILLTLICLLVISGCETSGDVDPLRVLGNPPSRLYYDSPFEYEFGATGGNGDYTFRYIQKPLLNDGTLSENELVFDESFTDTTKNKPSFFLKGAPLASQSDFEAGSGERFIYAIEVTDGDAVVQRQFAVTAEFNDIRFESNTGIFSQEGVVNDFIQKRFEALRAGGDDTVCDPGRTFDAEVLPDGREVYPTVIEVELSAPVATRTEFGYVFETNYVDSSPERSETNISSARPEADYVNDGSRTIVFEPGQIRCLLYVDMLDDPIIEDRETFSVTIDRRLSGQVTFEGRTIEITVSDDEVVPQYEFGKVTLTEGDSFSTAFSLPQEPNLPQVLNLKVVPGDTTASSDDYLFEPSQGQLIFEAGQLESVLTVFIEENNDGDKFGDDVLVIDTDISGFTEDDLLEITINEWPRDGAVQNEVVGRESNGEHIRGIAVNDREDIILAREFVNTSGNVSTELLSYRSDGVAQSFLLTGNFEQSFSTINVKPVAFVRNSNASPPLFGGVIYLIAEVDGPVGSAYFGERDFVLYSFNFTNDNVYELSSVMQLGTEGDDEVVGATLGDDNDIFIYGRTNGQNFQGLPSDTANAGGWDGFVYNIKDTISWNRFYGTDEDDVVTGVATSRTELVIVGETQNNDLDAFARVVDLEDGEPPEDARFDFELRSNFDDNLIDAVFADNRSESWMLGYGAGSPTSNQQTSTRTDDVFIYRSLTSSEALPEPLTLASNGEDVSKQLLFFSDVDDTTTLFVAGETDGNFDNGNLNASLGEQDSFIAVYTGETSTSMTFLSVTQFGTPGNDEIVNIVEANKRKILALWRENHTSGDGTYVYRISAFAPDGTKLSANP